MRRLPILIALLALAVSACGRTAYQSDDYTTVSAGDGVVLWRLAAGPAGIVGIGGPVTADDLEEGGGPFALAAYRSDDGALWDVGAALGSVESPAFGMTSWTGGYAVSGVIDGRPAVLRSADGLEWERADLPGTGDGPEDVEPAGIAAAPDGTLVVTGAAGSEPIVWVVPPGAPPERAGAPEVSGRLPQLAAGPAGFVASASGIAEGGAPPPIWTSADGRSWDPVADPFGGLTGVTGLVGGEAGYVAVVAVPGDESAYRLWTSADGRDWTQRADQDTVFSLLRGVTGDLYADLTAAPGEPSEPRPIAFAFDGRWLEIVEAFEGRRYLTVAVAVTDGIRVLSGFTGRDRPEPLMLRAAG